MLIFFCLSSFLFLFNSLQLDNKKLEALKKSKGSSAVMQVSSVICNGNLFHIDL